MARARWNASSRSLMWIAALCLSACGGGSEINGNTSARNGRTGVLSVALTDAPACGLDAVALTVQRVRVHPDANAAPTASGWTDIVLNPARKIDLLSLQNGVLDTLGQVNVAQGRYAQVRLVLQSNVGSALANSVRANGAAEAALDLPSDAANGIAFASDLNVVAGQTTQGILDLDACRSIVPTGNGRYQLKPVGRVIAASAASTITGTVTPGLAAATLSLQTLDSNARVIVAASTTPDSNGNFKFATVPPAASYTLVVAAPSIATFAVRNVPAVAATTTTLGVLPLPPAASVRSITGTVTPVNSNASVRAIQTLSNQPPIEVAYANATAINGSYRLDLPADAPFVSAYANGMVGPFTADLNVAGLYSIEASAPNGAVASTLVDVGIANAVRNFALTP